MSEVAKIYITEDKGLPMVSLDQVMAIAGKGLEGDRYAEGRGAYSISRVPKIRHVSLISEEAIAEANANLPDPFTDAETRRNIVTAGIELNELVGKEFLIGGIALRGVELCDPCHRPDKLAKKEGFSQAFQNLGGLRAEILTSGLIAVRDEIVA